MRGLKARIRGCTALVAVSPAHAPVTVRPSHRSPTQCIPRTDFIRAAARRAPPRPAACSARGLPHAAFRTRLQSGHSAQPAPAVRTGLFRCFPGTIQAAAPARRPLRGGGQRLQRLPLGGRGEHLHRPRRLSWRRPVGAAAQAAPAPFRQKEQEIGEGSATGTWERRGQVSDGNCSHHRPNGCLLYPEC